MFEWYLNTRITEGSKIISTVGGKKVEITAETIRAAYELPLATDVEVRSHVYDEKEFWSIIKNHSHSVEDIPTKGKTKDLLSPFYERVGHNLQMPRI